ncbi:hypothetical protein [Egicoccus sp. AB-alg6-2]|uniref:hypothetical protein n=1 Tax=Egicoccus sp. AB-alg6-2 TaxID=3242692 RepID=UPI00359D3AC7
MYLQAGEEAADRLARAAALAGVPAAIVTDPDVETSQLEGIEVVVVPLPADTSLEAGIGLIRRLGRTRPGLRVVAVGDTDSNAFSLAFDAGADAWVDHRAEPATIATAMTGWPGATDTDRRGARRRPARRWRRRDQRSPEARRLL